MVLLTPPACRWLLTAYFGLASIASLRGALRGQQASQAAQAGLLEKVVVIIYHIESPVSQGAVVSEHSQGLHWGGGERRGLLVFATTPPGYAHTLLPQLLQAGVGGRCGGLAWFGSYFW